MNLDNSGATAILGEKSKEAIELVKNKVTLLESEVARLSRLKGVIESDIRKAEAELASKNAEIATLGEQTEKMQRDIHTLNEELLTGRDALADVTKEHRTTLAEIKEKSDELSLREGNVVRMEEEIQENKKSIDLMLEETRKTHDHLVSLKAKVNEILTI